MRRFEGIRDEGWSGENSQFLLWMGEFKVLVEKFYGDYLARDIGKQIVQQLVLIAEPHNSRGRGKQKADIMSKNLWQELLAYDIFPFEESIPDNIRFKHSKNYINLNYNICYALPFYQETVDHEKGLNKEYLKYMVQRENTILRLITGLEVYLVDTFRMISESVALEMLDRSELAHFVTEFRLEKEYFKVLKESAGAINLVEIIPKRIDIQQKNKCKKAYSLIGINVTSVADGNQLIWNRIFNSKDGYMQTRHEIVHRGTVQTYSVNINGAYIKAAVIDIAKFIYNLDMKILSLYPKSDYPQFYIEKDSLLGVII